MIADNQKIMHEVLARSKLINKRKLNRFLIVSQASSLTIICLGAAVLSNLSDSVNDVKLSANGCGAVLLYASNVGGYALMGIVAFALGAIITLICMHIKNKE